VAAGVSCCYRLSERDELPPVELAQLDKPEFHRPRLVREEACAYIGACVRDGVVRRVLEGGELGHGEFVWKTSSEGQKRSDGLERES
jgi:hypothetical protein